MSNTNEAQDKVDYFTPMSGDDLDRIETTGGCEEHEFVDLVQTAQHYRQASMDLRDALRVAAGALEHAGFTVSADRAWAALARTKTEGERSTETTPPSSSEHNDSCPPSEGGA